MFDAYDIEALNLPKLGENLRWSLSDTRNGGGVYLTLDHYRRSLAGRSCRPNPNAVRRVAKKLSRNYERWLALGFNSANLPKVKGERWESDLLLLGHGTVKISLGKGSYAEAAMDVPLSRWWLNFAIKRLYRKRARLEVFNRRTFALPTPPEGARWEVHASRGLYSNLRVTLWDPKRGKAEADTALINRFGAYLAARRILRKRHSLLPLRNGLR